mmetsp:Transcript_48803/g.111157  ORF Transcript_48803/g.111157 Transcript_48803/m.111157 type:complete len:344 (+) Transcript_48803:612-1643(+)
MHQEVQLEAEAQELPILIDEVCKQRLAIPDVHDILYSEDVQVLSIDLHRSLLLLRLLRLLSCRLLSALLLRFLRFLCLLLLILLRLFLGRKRRLSLDGILELLLLPLPGIQELRPLSPLRLEPVGGLQLLHALRELPLQHPGTQIILALLLVLPHERHRVEALRLIGERELRVRESKLLCGQVRDLLLAERQLLLILSELHLDLLLHNLLLLCLLHLCVLLGLTLLLSTLLLALLGLPGLLCILDPLLFRLLRLAFLLLFQLLARRLCLLPLGLSLRLHRLLLEHELLHVAFEVGWRLAHRDLGHFLEVSAVKAGQQRLPFIHQEVSLDFHDDIIALQSWCNR